MIKNPFGQSWKQQEVHHRIREKLWRNPKVFENTVRDIEVAVAELQSSLQIGSDGKVAWLESAALTREWKIFLFILRKEDYRHLIARISDDVSKLQSIMDLNVELQPERRRRSQGRMLRLVRDLSGSIYNAIRMALACACSAPHHVGLGLKLLSQPQSAIPEDDEEDIVKSFRFHLVASYHNSSTDSDGSDPRPIFARRWCEMFVRSADECLTAPTCNLPISAKPARGVRFLSSFSSSGVSSSLPSSPQLPQPTPAMQSVSATTIMLSSIYTLIAPILPLNEGVRAITDMCQLIHCLGKQKSGVSCGFIIDDSCSRCRKYDIYPHGGLGNVGDWLLTSLRDVLDTNDTACPQLSYKEKVGLAYIISSSMLQLHKTPWLASSPTQDTIFLAQQAGIPIYDKAFVRKEMPDGSGATSISPYSTTCTKETLFSLGILLLELILCQVIGHVTVSSQPRDRLRVSELLDKAHTIGGPNYTSAVQRCLECEVHYGGVSLGEESYQKEISTIIGWLEDDLKAMQ
ncbi:hypothetical protein QBC38DRAFT_548908 [Podospora fimiseda]|uniref:DUF7580 domain-containing protein n=1 Tax=Podospora fimiseda TaxID=252190 RepID=A0AAN6YRM8_9PEZI|nr:hypothetical protein QBC38DRAFT_548908 [Podospora fimiseda]